MFWLEIPNARIKIRRANCYNVRYFRRTGIVLWQKTACQLVKWVEMNRNGVQLCDCRERSVYTTGTILDCSIIATRWKLKRCKCNALCCWRSQVQVEIAEQPGCSVWFNARGRRHQDSSSLKLKQCYQVTMLALPRAESSYNSNTAYQPSLVLRLKQSEHDTQCTQRNTAARSVIIVAMTTQQCVTFMWLSSI